MKKSYLLLFLAVPIMIETRYRSSSSYNNSSSYNQNNQNTQEKSGHYVFNYSGRTVLFNFYTKSLGSVLVASEMVGPLAFGGINASTTALDAINATATPSKISFHEGISSYITIDAYKIGSYRLADILKAPRDKSIKSIKIQTPNVIDFNYDYKITMDQDQLVITRLTTVGGMRLPGKDQPKEQQWPSAEDIAISRMKPAERIVKLQEQNKQLQQDISKLKSKIKKLTDSTKISNRKKMIERKKTKFKNNEKTIIKLQTQLAEAPVQPSNSTTPTTPLQTNEKLGDTKALDTPVIPAEGEKPATIPTPAVK